MIQLTNSQTVKCTKSITEFVEGKEYSVEMRKMTGRKYKDGKDPVNGKWLDKEGEPEDRLMLFSSNAYAARTKDVLDEHFETV